MEFSEVLKRRTIRLFRQERIPAEAIKAMVDAARKASCASNKQRLRYIAVQSQDLVEKILPYTAYAGLVQPRRNPVKGETAPTAFLAVYCTETPSPHLYADAGAAIQSIEFAAWERGIGCCWLGSFKPGEVAELLELPEAEKLIYLVALGYPAEDPVEEEVSAEGCVKYYLDEKTQLIDFGILQSIGRGLSGIIKEWK